MKRIILAAVMATAFISQPLAAQQAGSSSNSSSGSLASSNNSIVFGNVPTQTTQRQVLEGTRTLKAAPPVTAPSMGSGHPCGLAGSIGISIIGGGASGGVTQVDEACLLAQMGQGKAALIMIANRDAEACKALRATGAISARSTCNTEERRAAREAAQQPAVASTNNGATSVLFTKCERLSDGRINIAYKPGASKTAAQAQCSASLR